MKKNDSINFVFLFLCLLLLGFVYLNNKMPSQPVQMKSKAKTASGYNPVDKR